MPSRQLILLLLALLALLPRPAHPASTPPSSPPILFIYLSTNPFLILKTIFGIIFFAYLFCVKNFLDSRGLVQPSDPEQCDHRHRRASQRSRQYATLPLLCVCVRACCAARVARKGFQLTWCLCALVVLPPVSFGTALCLTDKSITFVGGGTTASVVSTGSLSLFTSGNVVIRGACVRVCVCACVCD
jgi:hypothetical protein